VKRRFRLTQSADFKRVRRLGKSYPHPLIVLVAMPNDLTHSRFAVVAGRVTGNAVQRNRAKRIIRAVLNHLLSEIPAGWDLIFIARRPMQTASYWQAQASIRHILGRAQLMRGDEGYE
jgi:ribonuclease P protein component